MKLKVVDLKDCSEYPKDFDNSQKRYVLERVVKEDGFMVSAYAIGYSDKRKDFDYIVNAVNYYNNHIDEKGKKLKIKKDNNRRYREEFFKKVKIGDKILYNEDTLHKHEALVKDINDTQIKLKWQRYKIFDKEGKEVLLGKWYEKTDNHFNNCIIIKI